MSASDNLFQIDAFLQSFKDHSESGTLQAFRNQVEEMTPHLKQIIADDIERSLSHNQKYLDDLHEAQKNATAYGLNERDLLDVESNIKQTEETIRNEEQASDFLMKIHSSKYGGRSRRNKSKKSKKSQKSRRRR
jgi:hypothetical protein